MIVADTSALLALFNAREPAHDAVASALATTDQILVVSPYVVAELDYLVATRLGRKNELAAIRELASGAYEHPPMTDDDLLACAEVVERYQDQQIGITDASLVVLAHRYRTATILTLDRRHFDVLRPLNGGRFNVLPPCSSYE